MTEAEERLAFVQGNLALALEGVSARPDLDPSAIVMFVLDVRDALGRAFATELGVDLSRVERAERAEGEKASPARSFAVFVSSPLATASALLRAHAQPKIAEAIESRPVPPRAVRIVGVARGGAAATAAVLPDLCPPG